MANSRDFTGKNRKFTGTKGITVSKGTTEQRVGSESGELRFNTTTDLMEYFDGTAWKPIDAPPSISTITTSDATGTNTILNADGSTLYTITINGGNFGAGVNVQFIGSTGTTYTAGNITRVSNSQITCTTTSSMGTADDPYDVKVINVSGLSIESLDAFSYNAPPVFATASGQLGTVYNGQAVSGSTLNASATDAEGNTITYSIISGSLPGSGLSLSSSTGMITGTLSGSPSLGNYPFVVQASTTEGTVNRQFSIQVVEVPFVAATGGTVLTCGNFKTHVFTSPGTFTVTSAGNSTGSNSVEYLVVAGGAGGAAGKCNSDGNHGGGGAGGYRTNYPSPATAGLPVSTSPGSYPVSVGGGGAGGSGPNANPTSTGVNGSPSVFSNITSAAGGGGGGDAQTPGSSGGSGGGGSGTGGSGGIGNTPPVSPSQGNNGGSGGGGPGSPVSGGGGGAGGTGENGGAQGGTTSGRGAVGAAIATAFFGPTAPSYGTAGPAPGRYFAGGGSGGRSNNITAGGAPPGGGGGGGSPNGAGNVGISGTINTGGGGGASGSGLCGNAQGGAGGSGIVVIRYRFQ